jgi:isopentenyl-diphosphate delta-isomerase
MAEPLIALVDSNDNIIGYGEKQQVHIDGILHRAFSILICNGKGEMLIHQRAHEKYHSPGLWTNACCSHLTEGEQMETVISERLMHEMGFSCPLKHLFTFHYRVEFDNGLVENEIDWVYLGRFDGTPSPNPSEVAGWKWVNIELLVNDIEKNPNQYTYWFRHIMQEYKHKVLEAFHKCKVA